MIPGAGPFTQRLREQSQPLFERFVQHPFQKALRAGTLLPSHFEHYLTQDALYLKEDAKAFAILAKRFEDAAISHRRTKPSEGLVLYEDAAHFFHQMAADSYALESEMQLLYFKEYHLQPALQPSETCRGYTDFLLHHATDSSLPIAAASLLPCFWLFQEASSEPRIEPNRYHLWLSTYSGEIYHEYTLRFILLLEHLIHLETPNRKAAAAEQAFFTAAEWECRFLEEALSEQSRPFQKGLQ